MPEYSDRMARQATERQGGQLLNKLLLLLLIHLFVIFSVATVTYGFDSVTGYSVVLGGLIFLIPNAYFAVCVFRYNSQLADRAVLHNFYKGETGKFLLSYVGFAAVFVLVKSINVVALFAAYIGLTLIQLFFIVRLRF